MEKSIQVSALKRVIIDTFLTRNAVEMNHGENVIPSGTRLRVRECGEKKLTTLLYDTGTLSSCIRHLTDETEIAFRELTVDEELGENALALSVARWFPKRGVLAPAFPYQETIIPDATWTVEDLKVMLSESTGVKAESISLAKPFSWELKDITVVPRLKWDKFGLKANLAADLRLEHGSVVVFKDNTVADIATEDCGANVSTPTRRSGGGIKIYSYAEQVARAAEKEATHSKLQSEQDQARKDAEERLSAAIKRRGEPTS